MAGDTTEQQTYLSAGGALDQIELIIQSSRLLADVRGLEASMAAILAVVREYYGEKELCAKPANVSR